MSIGDKIFVTGHHCCGSNSLSDYMANDNGILLGDSVTITNNLTVGNNIYVSEDNKVFYDN